MPFSFDQSLKYFDVLINNYLSRMKLTTVLVAVIINCYGVLSLDNSIETVPPTSFRHGHTNNWAVLGNF